jgi:hypothetical protein
MTLLVLGVNLTCHAKTFRYQSVRIWLGFHEDDKADPPPTTKASPAVVAYAPFVVEERWNERKVNVKETRGPGATVGVDYVGKNEGNAIKGMEFSYMGEHFDKGTADRLIEKETGRVYGVEWYCEQNDLQKFGVKPHFHLAILLSRSHNEQNKPITFSAVLDMRIEAGFMHDINQGVRRAFRLRKPEDAPIYFDPSRVEPQVHGLQEKGASLLEKVKKNKLGDLAEGTNSASSSIQPVAPCLVWSRCSRP